MAFNSFQDIYKELINCITRDDSLADISLKFKSLKNDFERIACCYSLLVFYNLLPVVKEPKRIKSFEVAEKYKSDGNRAFILKDDYLALYNYNRAITYAPQNSNLISVIFANRSAVTFSLEHFLDSNIDIDRALSADYPEHLKYKLFERKGKSLMKLGDNIGAENAFQAAVDCLRLSKLDSDKLKILNAQLSSFLVECRSCPIKKFYSAKENNLELTHGCNRHIQSASAALDIEYIPSMGRYLVATVDICPGDILAIEKPFSAITLSNSFFSHCYFCQKRSHSMLPCLECTLVCYCNEDCREKSWTDSHSIECSMLEPLVQLDCGKIELLSLRVLINATEKGRKLYSLASSLPDLESYDGPKRKGFTGDIYLSDSYKSIHNLEGNTGLREVSYLFSRSVMASCILHILNSCSDFFNDSPKGDAQLLSYLLEEEEKYNISWDRVFAGGLLLKYLQSMASNAHEVSEMRIMPSPKGNKVVSTEIGSAAYPLLSLINHSCDPNVVRHSHRGSTVVLTAIQLIKKGEQLFDNYGFHHATHLKEERHSHLKSQYYFTCNCLACLEDWPLYRNIPNENPTYLLGSNQKVIAKSSEKYKEILDKLTEEKFPDINPENLRSWLTLLYSHLHLLQENIKRPWQEFSGCQEVIKQCLSFLANHYFYKFYPQSLMDLVDKDTTVCPF